MRSFCFATLSGILLAAAKPDFYAILGIGRDESQHAIKQAYRQLSLKWHPDRHHTEDDREKAQDRFIDISEAYATLSDQDKRRIYDLSSEWDGGAGIGDMPEFHRPRTFHPQPSAQWSQAFQSQAYYSQKPKNAKQAYTGPSNAGVGGTGNSGRFDGKFVHSGGMRAPKFGGPDNSQDGGAHHGHDGAAESLFGRDWFSGVAQDDSGDGGFGSTGASTHKSGKFGHTNGMRAREFGTHRHHAAAEAHAAHDWFSADERDAPDQPQVTSEYHSRSGSSSSEPQTRPPSRGNAYARLDRETQTPGETLKSAYAGAARPSQPEPFERRQAAPQRGRQSEMADPNLFYGDVSGITELSVIGVAGGWKEVIEGNTENRNVLVIFYAPSSGRCKTLKPVFEEFAQKFATTGMIQVGAVDCDGHRARCINEMAGDIEDLPAVMYYGPNSVSPFVKVDQSMGFTGLSHWFQGVFTKVASRI